jgi:tRNA 2-selenouridine synthase
MVSKLDPEEFISNSENHSLIDVRSPAEYGHAHIPGAISLPLFSNEERAAVGTLYKQQGREQAMLLGLEYYGKNMHRIISGLKSETGDKQVFVHCWRGGMRSGVAAWMLDLFGYNVTTLNKGYKAFRGTVLDSFSHPKNILILGGKTGSAKTKVLEELKLLGEQVIDLEALAHHKGSSFGGINETMAPSQEQFENDLFMKFRRVDPSKPVWLEDESQRIGSMNLPNSLWMQMRNAKVIYLDIPFEERLAYLVDTYGSLPADELKAATFRIQKRLGGLNTKNAIQFLEERNLKEAFSILLKYYDKLYTMATDQRQKDRIEMIGIEKISPSSIAAKISHRLVASAR